MNIVGPFSASSVLLFLSPPLPFLQSYIEANLQDVTKLNQEWEVMCVSKCNDMVSKKLVLCPYPTQERGFSDFVH